MRISVVIPVLNGEHSIAHTIASVRDQTFEPEELEVIVVDDGSKDNSVAVAEEALAAHRGPRKILRVSGRGASGARNVGWIGATGQWIQFLDADDIIDKTKIAVQAEVARKMGEGVAVLYSPWQRAVCSGSELRRVGEVVRPRIGFDPVKELISSDNVIATGSQLIRKSWLDHVGGFDEEQRIIEDIRLLLQIAISGGQFFAVPNEQPLFFYCRRAETSLSRSNANLFWQCCVSNATLVEKYCRDKQELTKKRAEAIGQVYYQAARHFAVHDRNEFMATLQRIEALGYRVLPERPASLRLLIRLLGYRHAEEIAMVYRHLKAKAKRGAAVCQGIASRMGRGTR